MPFRGSAQFGKVIVHILSEDASETAASDIFFALGFDNSPSATHVYGAKVIERINASDILELMNSWHDFL